MSCLFGGTCISYESFNNEIAINLRCFLSAEILRHISLPKTSIPLEFADVFAHGFAVLANDMD